MSIIGIALMKIQKNLMPKSYFFYARLIDGIDERISFLGAIFRLIIPVIIGAITALGTLHFNLSDDPVFFGALASFGTIFLLVWPDFLNPELISQPYKNKKWKLFTLYLLLLVFFPFLGRSGAKLAFTFYKSYQGILTIIDLKAIVNNLISNFVYLLITSFFIYFQIRNLRIQSTKSDQKGTANRDADGM